MVRARCPYCGEENSVGLLQKKRPKEPVAMMPACEHVVFVALTDSPAAEYVHREFSIEFGTKPGSYSLEADLLRILNGHFKFVGPVAFAPSESAREAARRGVADFLRVRGFYWTSL